MLPPYAHQAAGRDEPAGCIDRRHRVAEGQCGKLFAPGGEKPWPAITARPLAINQFKRLHRSHFRCWH